MAAHQSGQARWRRGRRPEAASPGRQSRLPAPQTRGSPCAASRGSAHCGRASTHHAGKAHYAYRAGAGATAQSCVHKGRKLQTWQPRRAWSGRKRSTDEQVPRQMRAKRRALTSPRDRLYIAQSASTRCFPGKLYMGSSSSKTLSLSATLAAQPQRTRKGRQDQ